MIVFWICRCVFFRNRVPCSFSNFPHKPTVFSDWTTCLILQCFHPATCQYTMIHWCRSSDHSHEATLSTPILRRLCRFIVIGRLQWVHWTAEFTSYVLKIFHWNFNRVNLLCCFEWKSVWLLMMIWWLESNVAASWKVEGSLMESCCSLS